MIKVEKKTIMKVLSITGVTLVTLGIIFLSFHRVEINIMIEKHDQVAKVELKEEIQLSSTTSFVPTVVEKPTTVKVKDKKKEYIRRFGRIAQIEQQKYRIPASITIAQGILESGAGESRLATQNNNHFGIKCFSKSCKKGHCSNHEDDSHKDFFRIYNSAWQSYRAHSLFLQKDRYKHLKRHGNNYEAWAHGLKQAGYATDPQYGYKLIRLIEQYSLYELDQ